MLLLVGYNNPCASGGDKDEIRVRYPKPFAAIRAYLIGSKRHRSIEFTNRFDQHHAKA